MLRLLLYFVGVLAAAIGLSWLADQPGTLNLAWQGYEIETSLFRAVVIVALIGGALVLLWSILKQIFTSPANVGHYFRRRRQKKGLEALSAGMIAVGAGDRALATRYAMQARKSLPNEPLTHLLRAQTAQLLGDRATARRIYEAMRNNPETELLGLRGLYLEARHENEHEAARQYAERAVALNPKLGWSVDSLLELQCKDGDWASALDTLTAGRKNGHIEKKDADRRRAVLLTAQAIEAEDADMARALALSLEAHGLAPDLVPAAAIAGRLLASQGATPKAAKVIQKTWRRAPHPDLAAAYAYARIGDSPRDRLARVKELAHTTPHDDEGPIAVAAVAIEAQDWEEARRAIRHLVEGQPSQRVCTLMARIEGGQHANAGKVREWLARAVHAPRDPAWIADGHIASRWAPVSPVTGHLDAYRWEQPGEALERKASDLLLEQLLPVAGAVAGPAAETGPLLEIAPSAPDSARTDSRPDPDEHERLDESSPKSERAAPPPVKPAAPVEPARKPSATVASAKRSEPDPAVDAEEAEIELIATPARTSEPATADKAAVAAPPRARSEPVAEATAKPVNGARSDGSAVSRPPASAAPPESLAKAVDAAVRKTIPNGPNITSLRAQSAVVPVPTKPAAGTAGPANTAGKLRGKGPGDKRVFVPPRAPDDPGPEMTGEAEESRGPMTRFRPPPAKGTH
jgi:HemY protein